MNDRSACGGMKSPGLAEGRVDEILANYQNVR